MTWSDSGSEPSDRWAAGPPSALLAIHTEFSRGTATVVISGELDLVTRSQLSEDLLLILRRKPRRLIFDMARTSFLDCGSARLIAEAGQHLPGLGRPVIRHPSRAVRRVLELTALDADCEIEG
jgi:anti-anti-sigma factor